MNIKSTIRTKNIAILLLTALMLLVSGCGSAKLAEVFDEDTVIAAAKEVTGYVGDEDYESAWKMLREDIQELLPADKLKESMDTYCGDRGAFVEYKSIAVIGQKAKDTGEDVAVAVLVTTYENQKVTYTISFDADMKIIGFFLK